MLLLRWMGEARNLSGMRGEAEERMDAEDECGRQSRDGERQECAERTILRSAVQ
jgi:hypothetical protein